MEFSTFTKDCPIGVIDSGIGGFSVARRVQKLLPHENILYLGDGANTPYGNHSAEEILELTRYLLHFMREHRVKGLLVACNTISCLIDQYREEMECPVFSVVEAGANAVARTPYQKVGVISTCFTAKTGCYPELIGKLAPGRDVFSQGCPKLANLVEQNVGNAGAVPLIEAEIRENIEQLLAKGTVECCVLGCTHYPLIEDNIHKLYPGIKLLDPAKQMAEALYAYLDENGLLNDQKTTGRLDIFTTGSLEEYIKKANCAGLNPIHSVQYLPSMQLAKRTAV